MTRNFTLIVLLAVAALLAAMGSVFVVNESQTAIVLNLGRVVRADLRYTNGFAIVWQDVPAPTPQEGNT